MGIKDNVLIKVENKNMNNGAIMIPIHIAVIEDKKFNNCYKVKYIELRDNVLKIGEHRFDDCSILKLEMNNGVLSGCISLKKNIIPDNITYIQDIQDIEFLDCHSLKVIAIPNSVTNIGDYRFSDCISLEKIIIPNNVVTISDRTFEDCSSLKEIVIPNSVTTIGSAAFQNCSSLKEITIPKSVTHIGPSAFNSCSSLEKITIPDGVTRIYSKTFADCSSLKEITIPHTVTCINSAAFLNCCLLKEIVIPNSVTEIGYYVFEGCSSLEKITIPNSVKNIWDLAFKDCMSLKEITFSKSVTNIGNPAFKNCNSLEEFTIPKSIKHMSDNVLCDNSCYRLNINTSLLPADFYLKLRLVNKGWNNKILCINGNDIIINITDINCKNSDRATNKINSDLRLIRIKEIKENIEFLLMKNTLFDKKYLNDKKHDDFISNIIYKLENHFGYDICDYQKDLNEYVEAYIQKHTKASNLTELNTINDTSLQNVLNYLNNYKVLNIGSTNPSDFTFYGRELEEVSTYISTAHYQIVAKYSSEIINIKMKKMLDNLTTISGNSNIFAAIFIKNSNTDIKLNNDIIKQLKFYSEYKLEQVDEEVTLLELLKEIIKKYITIVEEHLKYLDSYVSKTQSTNILSTNDNNQQMVFSLNDKRYKLQTNLAVMVKYYQDINSIIKNNLSYMIKLNDIRTTLLPALVLECTKNNWLLKKQDSIEKINNIIYLFEEIIKSDRNKINQNVPIPSETISKTKK